MTHIYTAVVLVFLLITLVTHFTIASILLERYRLYRSWRREFTKALDTIAELREEVEEMVVYRRELQKRAIIIMQLKKRVSDLETEKRDNHATL